VGRTYSGTYTLKDRWITVHTNYGSESGAVYEGPPGQLQINNIAKMLMLEIIDAAKRAGHID
jgi:hypothetical protein